MQNSPPMGRTLLFACLMLLCGAIPQHADAATRALYDGALGGTPDTQGMLFQNLGATQSTASGITTLDSSAANLAQAGYSPNIGSQVTLDRTQGYALRFRVALASETHAGSDRNADGIDDRAGFSVIVLSSDLQGVELGFWPDRVWAQADEQDGAGQLFTQAEHAALDTSLLRDYQLTVRGDTYQLTSGATSILSGRLRNYSSFGFPYTQASFIFLGDDTTSARAVVRIGLVGVSTYDQRVSLPLIITSP